MENASKALLMASGVLIGIIVISMSIYLFASYRKVQTTYDAILETNEKIKFNTKFEKFKDKTDITPQEIVSVINFARNYKINNEIHIKVCVEGTDYVVKEDHDLIEFIKNSNNKYKCSDYNGKKAIDYDGNGIVEEINFFEE